MASDHGVALTAGVTGAPTCVDCHDEHQAVAAADTSSPTSRIHRSGDVPGVPPRQPGRQARASRPRPGSSPATRRACTARADEERERPRRHLLGLPRQPRDAEGIERRVAASTSGTSPRPAARATATSRRSTCRASTAPRSRQGSPPVGDVHRLPRRAHDPRPRRPALAHRARNVSAQVCSPCHASVRLTQKYGLAGRPVPDASRTATTASPAAPAPSKSRTARAATASTTSSRPSDPTLEHQQGQPAEDLRHVPSGANENFTRGRST